MNTIYTYGYSNSDPQHLARYAAHVDAIVIDTRMKPVSRNPGWNKGRLQALLGERYLHVGALGNVNYKTGGEIKLADPDRGVEIVSGVLTNHPVILLCACKDVAECHRKVAAELIAEHTGAAINHLTLFEVKRIGSAQAVQRDMFGEDTPVQIEDKPQQTHMFGVHDVKWKSGAQ